LGAWSFWRSPIFFTQGILPPARQKNKRATAEICETIVLAWRVEKRASYAKGLLGHDVTGEISSGILGYSDR
jgi:hypothetical protein